MTRVLLLAVCLFLAQQAIATAGPPLEPAPGSAGPAGPTAPTALRRAGQEAQPAPDEAQAPEQPTPSPPADVSPAQETPPPAAQPGERGGQTIEDDVEAEEPQQPAAGGTPRDLATFAESTMGARRLRFALNAFGDASLIESIPEGPDRDERSSFQLGTLALLINAQLGSSLLGIAEMAFDAKGNNDQDVKLERLQLRWQTDRYYVTGGRLHTDIGYWNAAFHHGAWLFLPVVRPRVVRGEGSGGLLPIHWIGLEAGIMLPIEPGLLIVSAGVGNGRGDAETTIQLRGDTNDFKALKLRVEYQGLGLPDLRVGAAGLYDHIAAKDIMVRPALPDEEIDEYIGNVFAAYRGAQTTIIAEGYGIFHHGGDHTFSTTDAFVVAGYRIGRVTPYVLVERTDALGSRVDPFYTPTPGMTTPSTPVDQTNAIGGVRLDVSVWSALKAEYGMLYPDDADGPDHTVMLNWSFGI
jgi:hypothetical protein